MMIEKALDTYGTQIYRIFYGWSGYRCATEWCDSLDEAFFEVELAGDMQIP